MSVAATVDKLVLLCAQIREDQEALHKKLIVNREKITGLGVLAVEQSSKVQGVLQSALALESKITALEDNDTKLRRTVILMPVSLLL